MGTPDVIVEFPASGTKPSRSFVIEFKYEPCDQKKPDEVEKALTKAINRAKSDFKLLEYGRKFQIEGQEVIEVAVGVAARTKVRVEILGSPA
jgi:hypothetical protein